MEAVGLTPVLVVSTALFTLGVIGVLTRKNALIVFMSVELMLNGVNLAFVGFSRQTGSMDGHVFAIFVMAVAAAEAAVGLALVILLFRNRLTVQLDDLDRMGG
ncbi:NADH-quinone oxidoreductase subunit K 1 [Deltaproteobacteria bacterium]|nr:NADH-quinone oxidoreductase subunit K 1 [Deltaproteobacteria bacterium]